MTDFPLAIEADIYRIDNLHIVETTEDYIYSMVSAHSSGINHENHTYNEIIVKDEVNNLSDFDVKLFVVDDTVTRPDWLDFLEAIVPDDSRDELNHLHRRYPSFILFIYSEEFIYAVSKGNGRYVFAESIFENFGIEILERLVDADSSELRNVNERGILGRVLTQSKSFKPDYKFSDENSFGKFYRGIDAAISKDRLRASLGVETTRNSLLISGQNTLKIRGKITISELLTRINLVENLFKREKTFVINKFSSVKGKILKKRISGEVLEITLHNLLIVELFELYQKDELIEVYHPSIDDYLKCEKVIFTNTNDGSTETLRWQARITLQRIFGVFELRPNNIDEFKDVIFFLFGAFEIDGVESNGMRLDHWLSGEVTYLDKKYFKFDGKWYTYESTFLEELDKGITSLFNKVGTPEVLNNWNYTAFSRTNPRTNEYQYNLSFKLRGCIVCDRALIDNVEICDFFRVQGDQITLYHVKKGWGQSIRVVCNQILIGARLLSNMRLVNDIALKKRYYQAVKNKSYQNEDLKEKDFDKLITIGKIKFCLVYGTENDIGRNFEITSSNSNLAKLTILQCENDLRTNLGFDFDIVKVKIV